MKKKLFIIGGILVGAMAMIWLFGLYPVARVNGDFIMHRAYSGRVKALESFEEKNRLLAGGSVLTEEEKNTLRQIILQSILTERVFQQYVAEHTALQGIEESAHIVVERTLKDADPDVLPQATKEVYGWSVDEFMENVLYPQAFQNELQKAIEADGTPFETFAKSQLENAEISLYAVS